MERHIRFPKMDAQRGAATVFTAVAVVGLGAMSLGLLAMNLSVEKEQRGRQRALASFYAAEAGLSAGYQSLLNGGDGSVASEDEPEAFGSAEFFVVPQDLGDDQTSLVAVATDNGAVSRAELVVRRVPNGPFQHGAFGNAGVTLASGSFVDSYDSTVGAYAGQVGASGHANEKGHVASNANVTLEIDTEVYGDASPGVTGVLDDNALIVTGSTAPLASAVAMPQIAVPLLPALPGVSTLNSFSIPPGNHHYTSIMVNMGDTLTITGPAVVVIDDLEMRSNATLQIDATLGPVEIYGTGSFELRNSSRVNTYASSPRDVSVKLTGDNYGDEADGSVITMSSVASFTGTIYAPNAKIVIPSTFEVFGAVKSDVLHLASDSNLHYDESLARTGPGDPPAFETLLWRPMGAQ